MRQIAKKKKKKKKNKKNNWTKTFKTLYPIKTLDQHKKPRTARLFEMLAFCAPLVASVMSPVIKGGS